MSKSFKKNCIDQLLTGVDQQTAEQCLIQSIYKTDEKLVDLTVEQHIAAVAHNPDHVNIFIHCCFVPKNFSRSFQLLY